MCHRVDTGVDTMMSALGHRRLGWSRPAHVKSRVIEALAARLRGRGFTGITHQRTRVPPARSIDPWRKPGNCGRLVFESQHPMTRTRRDVGEDQGGRFGCPRGLQGWRRIHRSPPFPDSYRQGSTAVSSGAGREVAGESDSTAIGCSRSALLIRTGRLAPVPESGNPYATLAARGFQRPGHLSRRPTVIRLVSSSDT